MHASENIAEYIAEYVTKTGASRARAGTHARFNTGMAELIVRRTLLRIG
jgi:hypothetical protein